MGFMYYRHLLELYMAEQAKGHIFSAKKDYLKGERFVMVGDFELTHCLYLTIDRAPTALTCFTNTDLIWK
jgi:hypothetical protein